MLFGNTGILISFIIGASFDYRLIPCISIIIPISFAIIFAALPNTPLYYFAKSQHDVSVVKFREIHNIYFDNILEILYDYPRKQKSHSNIKVDRMEISNMNFDGLRISS